jgi:hypothetical protein
MDMQARGHIAVDNWTPSSGNADAGCYIGSAYVGPQEKKPSKLAMWLQVILGIFFMLAFVSGLPKLLAAVMAAVMNSANRYAYLEQALGSMLGSLLFLLLGWACLRGANRNRIAIQEAKEASRAIAGGQADNHL